MPAILSSPEPVDSEAERREIDRRRGRFVPWLIAAFYITFMSALIGFVVIAYGHPPNEVTANAYEKGLDYNTTLGKADAQAQLGWTSKIRYEGGRVIFELRDGHHQPVERARVKAWFIHPDEGSLDRSFSLSDEGHGVYSADAPLPAAGLWSLHVTAERMDKEYQASTQIEIE